MSAAGTRLAGRVAIVTGGARGLGVHYCRALAAAGAAVASIDVVEPLPDAAASPVPLRLLADVADEGAVEGAVRAVMQRFGRIDILVNNAAVASVLQPVAPTELEVELWDRVMAVNVRGPFLMSKHVAKLMIAQGSGKIINISSGVAYKGMKGLLHYVTSKAAVLGLTRGLARDLGPHGICVNTIAPGFILSDSLIANQPDLGTIRETAAAARALVHEGRPADLFGALLFLASSDSDYMSGQTLVLDGGTLFT